MIHDLTENELGAWRLYAAAALTGLLANETYNRYTGIGDTLCGGIGHDDAVSQAGGFADSMIEIERTGTSDLQEFLAAKARGATAPDLASYKMACRSLEQATDRTPMAALQRWEEMVGA